MKKFAFLSLLIFISCNTKPTNKSLARKRIIQRFEANSVGMAKNLKITDLTEINDTTFSATIEFFNSLFDKEVKTSYVYHFDKNMDSIIKQDEKDVYIKSENEWVKIQF